jgi:hypothetical protein
VRRGRRERVEELENGVVWHATQPAFWPPALIIGLNDRRGVTDVHQRCRMLVGWSSCNRSLIDGPLTPPIEDPESSCMPHADVGC